MSNQDIPGAVDQYGKSGLYNAQMDTRNDFGNMQHKRQASTLHHGSYNHPKSHSINEQSPRRSPKEGVYGQVPDLPPRIDRAIKPISLLTTPSKIPNGLVYFYLRQNKFDFFSRSAHERLFGTKQPGQPMDSAEQNNNENNNFSNKLGSLERSQNSKSVSNFF